MHTFLPCFSLNQNQLERFEKLMEDMFDYLESVSQATTMQAVAVEAQLQESVEALHDMEKMRPNLASMEASVGEQLSDFFQPPYIQVGCGPFPYSVMQCG